MPAVAVPPRLKGLPTATTQSPTRGLARSSKLTKGKSRPSTLITARSVAGSRPITRAVSERSSLVRTVILSAPCDHVVVGDDVAVGGDEEAGARRPHRGGLRGALELVEEERQLAEGGGVAPAIVVAVKGLLACEGGGGGTALADDVDGHDGRGHPLDDVGEGDRRDAARGGDRHGVDRARRRGGERPMSTGHGEAGRRGAHQGA